MNRWHEADKQVQTMLAKPAPLHPAYRITMRLREIQAGVLISEHDKPSGTQTLSYSIWAIVVGFLWNPERHRLPPKKDARLRAMIDARTTLYRLSHISRALRYLCERVHDWDSGGAYLLVKRHFWTRGGLYGGPRPEDRRRRQHRQSPSSSSASWEDRVSSSSATAAPSSPPRHAQYSYHVGEANTAATNEEEEGQPSSPSKAFSATPIVIRPDSAEDPGRRTDFINTMWAVCMHGPVGDDDSNVFFKKFKDAAAALRGDQPMHYMDDDAEISFVASHCGLGGLAQLNLSVAEYGARVLDFIACLMRVGWCDPRREPLLIYLHGFYQRLPSFTSAEADVAAQLLRRMIERFGCDPNQGNNSMGWTMLHEAVAQENVALVRLMLELGADPVGAETIRTDSYRDARQVWQCGTTPLSMVREMLDSGYRRPGWGRAAEVSKLFSDEEEEGDDGGALRRTRAPVTGIAAVAREFLRFGHDVAAMAHQ